MIKNFIPEVLIREQVRAALAEDVGSGDRTAVLIPQDSMSEVNVVCREEAVLCGVDWFNEVFHQLLPDMKIEWFASDGDDIAPDSLVCRFAGGTRGLLTGERTALNYLQTLSGTATLARCYAHRVASSGVRILDTRKTIPGLRLQQKYAVSCGGCYNHRIGLFDAILIKENHILAAGSVEAALSAGLKAAQGLEVEIEVESLEELQRALDAGAKRVLLDNFDLEGLREAVAFNAGRARLEASGNVNLDTVLAIAETGVDDISVGSLTKDVRAVDFSMRFS